MTQDNTNYQKSKLWQHAFEHGETEYDRDEQEFWKVAYINLRKKVKPLLSRISVDMDGYTIHDISHVDALWEIADSIVVDDFKINPTEAFVFGASALIHDAGMTLSAYNGGLSELKETTEFKNQLAYEFIRSRDSGVAFDLSSPPDEKMKTIITKVLRRLHPDQAKKLATQYWTGNDENREFLIDNEIIRKSYGNAIGEIAKSHGYPIEMIETTSLSDVLNVRPDIPSSVVDTYKIACLLRISDALHIDCRRAPPFLHRILDLGKDSDMHYTFQERMSRFNVEEGAVVFRTSWDFEISNSESWWLAHDTLVLIDRELREVNEFLQSKGKSIFQIHGIKGIESPETLAKYVMSNGWQPVDTRLGISDVSTVIKRFGGFELYGNDPRVAVRELIQNSADAINLRCSIESRKPEKWGCIKVGLKNVGEEIILFVEDNGVGMSKSVLTKTLLDFGNSLWRSNEIMDEFPKLLSSEFEPIGKFGIGFFSIFMLGSKVKVYSRKYKIKDDKLYLLEFSDGLDKRPVLSPISNENSILDGGTRIEVILKNSPHSGGGLLSNSKNSNKILTLAQLVGAIAPNLEINIEIDEFGTESPITSDWKTIPAIEFSDKISATKREQSQNKNKNTSSLDYSESIYQKLMQPLMDSNGNLYGRAMIDVRHHWRMNYGCISSKGIRVRDADNICGVIFGKVNTLDRKTSESIVPKEVMSAWATEQAELISTHIIDSLIQAKTAEIVLGCGGEIGNLKIVQFESKWYSQQEFTKLLNLVKKVRIIPERFQEFQSIDEFYQEEFESNFSPDRNVIKIPDYNSSLIIRSYTGQNDCDVESEWEPEINTQLGKRILSIIEKTWEDKITKKYSFSRIGNVGDESILRNVLIIENK